jgi:isoleucyl-tRNA synthetase
MSDAAAAADASLSNAAINYKDTLNLPVTGFQMKAGAAKREPEIEAFWEEHHVYERAQAARDKQHRFLLHDGPPYLSADKIHIGTALNKILKDIVTRYKTQRGYYSPYVPGYDGHGLPIENAVVKNIQGGRHAITPLELRKRCRAFALKNLAGQEANFKRLGVWGNWAKPYITIDADFEATQVRLFGDMYQKGYVYKGLKPVYWCPTCETALADAEVEYADHRSWSLYVRFPVDADTLEAWPETDPEQRDALRDAGFVIWTTTPWTLPANLALSVHPDFQYVVLQHATFGKVVVAAGLAEAFCQAVGWGQDSVTRLTQFPGQALSGLAGSHPFIDRRSPLLMGAHVTLDAGTGIVHTAPGHGMEDYVVVQKYDQDALREGRATLGILSPVDSRGLFTAEAGDRFQGQFYEKANPGVVALLEECNALLHSGRFTHSYPHCWRCQQPVIYRATEQWFIGMASLRPEALAAIRTVAWVPARGESRITAMVENRGDWCISRQRVWGVPIPVFYCANETCRHVLLSEATMAALENHFRVHTSDIWWEWPAERLLPEGTQCPACAGSAFVKETDIMDVWFDSGVTHTAVVDARQDELGPLPVDLYLEGSDQHRGWFQSSLLTSVMLRGQAPYRQVLTHGFVLDADGRKMSKSLGNVIDPQAVISQYGADILRLWVASVDYASDVRIGQNTLTQLAEVYKKIRNTVRYVLGNLADYDPARHRVDLQRDGSLLDHWVMARLAEVLAILTDAFDQYEFHKFYQVLQNFCVVDLSALYFDVAKDPLYCNAPDSPARRAIQTVLHEILSVLVRVLVPVMPHLAEDMWLSIPEHQRPCFDNQPVMESVLLTPWPAPPEGFAQPAQRDAIHADMTHFMALKEAVNKLLEGPRAEGRIGSSLEAAIYIRPPAGDAASPAIQAFLQHAALLPSWLIVSEVIFSSEAPTAAPEVLSLIETPGFHLTAGLAPGDKCARCWKFVSSVGSFPDHPTLCARCHEAVCMVH